jgi:hypothetical protein
MPSRDRERSWCDGISGRRTAKTAKIAISMTKGLDPV